VEAILGCRPLVDSLAINSENLEGLPLQVVILMSTFNGERYVTAQLQSILAQLPVSGRILIRDDGSTDRTIDAIRALNDDRIEWMVGPNLGFGASFLTLLANAPSEADMVMFADQDDVWLPCKVERAWAHLRPLGIVPGLYGSAKMLVDQGLRQLAPSPAWPRGPSFSNALMENIITGCTAAINQPALVLMKQAGVASGVHFHDWWLYLVVSAFGQVVYDNEPTLLYRQHAGNQIGQGAGRLGRFAQIVRFLARHDWIGIQLAQIGAFRRHYGDFWSTCARDTVLRHFCFNGDFTVPRWRLIFGTSRWRQFGRDEFYLRVLLTLHKVRVWPLPHRRL
jgi:glycosyltransferase involved in cell wall biosynthesis